MACMEFLTANKVDSSIILTELKARTTDSAEVNTVRVASSTSVTCGPPAVPPKL